MSKLSLIIGREYMQRVRKKSFLLLTFLMPLLFVALIFVPLWLASIKSGETSNVVILDETGKYASLFDDTDAYHFVCGDRSLEAYRTGDHKEIFAFVSITADLLQQPDAATLYSQKPVPNDLYDVVNRTLTKQIERDKLASFQIPDLERIIEDSRVSFDIRTVKWGKDGAESDSSTMAAHLAGFLATFVIYMFIMMYGALVMQGVMEEKTSRIAEIMVSSVKPFDLMMGKIIGIGLVGLTQIMLWLILAGGMLSISGLVLPFTGINTGMSVSPESVIAVDSSSMQGMDILRSLNIGEMIVCFIFYFTGGYLLYASIFAAIGSAVNSPEDTHQFMTPVTLLLIFSLYIGLYSIENPDGPVAFWCSLIPFTSSVVMMIRIPFEAPLWEILLSTVLLFTTAIGVVYFAAKIYRIGILMYGKKPHLKEILKWISFK